MEIKQLEIRDAATFIPVLAIKCSGNDGYLFSAAGYGEPLIILIDLASMRCAYAAYDWSGSGRTMPAAHDHIEQCWDNLQNEDVIDIEFIMGTKSEKKVSQRFDK